MGIDGVWYFGWNFGVERILDKISELVNFSVLILID